MEYIAGAELSNRDWQACSRSLRLSAGAPRQRHSTIPCCVSLSQRLGLGPRGDPKAQHPA
jgi:hypothetical protein